MVHKAKAPNKASCQCTGIMHPNPGKVRRGQAGGSRRVFKQFPGSKPIPSKRRYLVPPTSGYPVEDHTGPAASR